MRYTLSILESEIEPLFEDRVKISDFHIFTDSDRKKSELLYDVYCYSIVYFVLAQKCIQFHIVKKITNFTKPFSQNGLFPNSIFKISNQ